MTGESPDHPSRRASDERLASIEGRVAGLEASMAANTEITSRTAASVAALETNLSGIVKFSKAVDGTVELAGIAGKVAKWLTTVAAALVLVWLVFKYIVLEALKAAGK